ncbi:MAG: SF1B family DNA helicase RecD2 [Erysipelotrichaceae bacterium]
MDTRQLKGKIKHFIFENASNLYGVAILITSEEEDEVVITGPIAHLQKQTAYQFEGRFVDHDKYGLQFMVTHSTLVIDDPNSYLVAFFSSERFSGIGKKTAQLLVEQFGLDAIELLKAQPELLETCDFLNAKKRQAIQDGLMVAEEDDAILFFSSLGLSSRNIALIQHHYPQNSVSIIKDNPYRMVMELHGIGFVTADKLGTRLGFAADAPQRLQALVYQILVDACFQSGDAYFLEAELFGSLCHKSRLDSLIFSDIVKTLCFEGYLKQEVDHYYLSEQHLAEVGIAHFIHSFPQVYMEARPTKRIKETVALVAKEQGIVYDAVQNEAIQTFFNEDMMIISGGPGTGKTTIVKGIIESVRLLYPYAKILLTAPTGRAAKRMSEVCNVDATTIHSLLKWNLDLDSFGKNANDPLDGDILIVDEFSMVDSLLFYRLLAASHSLKKIILIGDDEQLPSILAGNVLSDLMKSGFIPTICLERIYRQSEGSAIIDLAHTIKEEQALSFEKTSDVLYLAANNAQLCAGVVSLVQSAVERGYDLSEIQVLAPMYKGAAGIDAINQALQETCNPYRDEASQMQVGSRLFRVNDKVIQLKNQANDEIYNGDIGVVVDVAYYGKGHVDNALIVAFDGNEITYQEEQLIYLRLAYCISIHKSQGSEYPIVILPISKEHTHMLQKKLLYTAITRAKRSLIVLGDLNLFAQAIHKGERQPRRSTLGSRITALFT